MEGCVTAILTPFTNNYELDTEGFRQLVQFQVRNGIKNVVVAGTTGEAPTLCSEEFEKLIQIAIENGANVIANTGFNDTRKTLAYTREAYELGCRSMLLVDPYYNGPSSIEIRKEYYEPVAERFQDCKIIPYIIPSRTGTECLPVDLAILHSSYPNIDSIKDATGDDNFSKELRALCGPSFNIFSGDDDRTYHMMSSKDISAAGVISVVSNIFPQAVKNMVDYLHKNQIDRAKALDERLRSLFQLVTFKVEETMKDQRIQLKFRNPVPFKTIARLLGVPSGPCRRPLGKVTKLGLKKIVETLRYTFEQSPELFEPLEKMFDIRVEDRLTDARYQEDLYYEG